MTFLIIIAVSVQIILIAMYLLKGTNIKTSSMNNTNDHLNESCTSLAPGAFAERYNGQQGQVKGGSICFWGHWFGKPYDNFHEITSVDFDTATQVLTIHFAGQEILTVTNPADIKEYTDRLIITKADHIYWQWYAYGKAQAPEHLLYYDIGIKDGSLIARTNADRFTPGWKDLAITKPAVLLA